MKPIAMPGLLSLALLIPGPMARADDVPTTLFKCAIGKKTVSVTRTGDQITYHYGTGGKDEMSIVGTPGNIFQMSQRYAGWNISCGSRTATPATSSITARATAIRAPGRAPAL